MSMYKRCFIICCVFLWSCQQHPNTAPTKQQPVLEHTTDSSFLADSVLIFKDSFFSQLTFPSDSTFDTLLLKHFDYSAQSLSSIERSMADHGLVDVLDVIPSIKVDLRYATADNFVGEVLYPSTTRCFLRMETILKLLKAACYLKESNPAYTFIIFDGARPQSVQYKMYEMAKSKGQTKYVASPLKGSLHNFGTAVDISLFDLDSNKELDMGTPFDFFGPEAQPRFQESLLREGKLSALQLSNRNLLKKVMKKAGFRSIQTEWWHFEAFEKNYVRSVFKIIP